MGRLATHHRRGARRSRGPWTAIPRAAAFVVVMTLLATLTACTSDERRPATRSSSSVSASQEVADGATLEPAPVALDLEVARVAGRMKKAKVRALKAQVGDAVTSYLDQAFLEGAYPRTSFTKAFAPFRPALRPQAERDAGVLTNVRIGERTTRIVPRTRRVRLNVVAEEGTAIGVTARVAWVYRALVRGHGERRGVSGRLLLTPSAQGRGWAIFGYDLHSGLPDRGGHPGEHGRHGKPGKPRQHGGHDKRDQQGMRDGAGSGEGHGGSGGGRS